MSPEWHAGHVVGATLSPMKPVCPHARHRIANDEVVEIEGAIIEV
jgi:hypothetical protein